MKAEHPRSPGLGRGFRLARPLGLKRGFRLTRPLGLKRKFRLDRPLGLGREFRLARPLLGSGASAASPEPPISEPGFQRTVVVPLTWTL